MSKHPDPVDMHVGAKIRVRRRELGVTQQALAEALALTFQQVQKYERGMNRVSASKLFQIAHTLDAPPAWFFEGFPGVADAPSPGADVLQKLASATHGVELAQIFLALPRDMRDSLMSIARALAGAGALKAAAGAHLRQAS